MAFVDKMCCRTVDDDLTGAFSTFNDVGFQTSPVGNRSDEYFFTYPKIRGSHEIGWDGDAAFVGNIGVGDGGAVKFGFELSS